MIASPPARSTIHAASAVYPLLPLKLAPPPLRDGMLLRPDLQALIAEVRLHALTLVVAPAGYGKTTLLCQWSRELKRTGVALAWITLDRSETDPALFLAYLIRSFQSLGSNFGTEAWRLLSSTPNLHRDWPIVAGALCSDLQRYLVATTFLVIDDLHHVVDSAVINQIFSYVLRAAPPTLHIVLSSRRAPFFAPLARIRSAGSSLELSQRDLKLTAEEARQLLATQNVVLSDDDISVLLARTEGWPISIQLVARALAGRALDQRGQYLRALAGSHDQMLQFLTTEVLADLPAELVDFLRLAALPERFDTRLLADVLDRDDIDYLLGRAQALGLPILPVNEHGDQLRLHPLWRELLLRGTSGAAYAPDRSSAHQSISPPLALLHQRFGRVFEQRGELTEAFRHYAAAGATIELARALRSHAWPLLHSPRRAELRNWIETISEDIRASDPELLYMWGYSQTVSNPNQAIAAIEHAADMFRQDNLFDRELRALADLAALLHLQGHSLNLMSICVRAVRAANRVNDSWSRGASLVAVTAILAIKGRTTAALRVARQAAGHPLSSPWHWLMAMLVASINNRLGCPVDALHAIDEALQLQLVDQDDRLRQNLLRHRAMSLYEMGYLNEATTLAFETYRHLGDYYRDGSAGLSARQLAWLLALQGRFDEAMTYVSQARTAFHELGALAPLASLQAIELYLSHLRGQANRPSMAVNSVLRRLDEAEHADRDLRLRLMLALVLGESGEQTRAFELARETADQMQRAGYRLFLAATLLYCGYLAGRIGNDGTRDDLLRQGWNVVADNHYHFIPMLPSAVLRDVTQAALRQGIASTSASTVLLRQLSKEAPAVCAELMHLPDPAVRAIVARLLGELGARVAYPSLKTLAKDKSAVVRQIAQDSLNDLVYHPPYKLRIQTLGGFRLWRDDHEVRERDWRSAKARQLFQLLIAEHGRAIPRERVYEALWPDLDADAAGNNMRVTINRLGKAIEPERPDGAPSAYLQQVNDTFSFNTGSAYELDSVDFTAAVFEGQRALYNGQRTAAITAFRKAIELYGGPFLPDNLYEDWTTVERERLAMLFNDAALRLGELRLDEGLAHEAIGLAWRVLENDRAHEEAYRLLMRAHAALGERSTALRLYARCEATLKEELGVEPLPETVKLFHTLHNML